MRFTRRFIILPLIAVVLALPHCKKTPTVPNADVLSMPVIWVNTFEMSFAASVAGANPAVQILSIKNSGKATLNYSIASESDWATVSEESGVSTGQVTEHTITVDKSGLPPQEEPHTAVLTVTSSEAYNNPQKITVSLFLSEEPPPTIQVSPGKLTFTGQVDGSNPAAQKIFVKNTGGDTLHFEITTDEAWLSVDPESGQSRDEEKGIKVNVNTQGLKEGTYKGKIRIADSRATNSPQTVSVTLNMSKDNPPRIKVRPASLSFQAFLGGSNPRSQDLYVSNSGEGTLTYNLAGDAGWLSVSPDSGSSGGAEKRHTVSVNAGGLSTGNYNGTILISDPNAVNNPVVVDVTLTVIPPLTDNKVGISISPNSGGTNTIITVSITILGNTSQINAGFGLDLQYNATLFEYQDTKPGSLTSNWSVGGGANSGIIKVGGFRGIGSVIPVGSQGTIAVVTLKVIGTNGSSTLSISNFIDDIAGMIASPSSATFTIQ